MSDENDRAVDRLIAQIESIGEQKQQKATLEALSSELARIKGNLSQPAKIDLIREGGKIVGGTVHRGGVTQKVMLG